MQSTMPLALLLLVVLITALIALMQTGSGLEKIPEVLKEEFGIDLPKFISAPSPLSNSPKLDSSFSSGNSRFSQGECRTNTECQIGGCSGEVCASQDKIKEGIVTTCEYSDSFPNAQGLSCQCVNKKCGWQ